MANPSPQPLHSQECLARLTGGLEPGAPPPNTALHPPLGFRSFPPSTFTHFSLLLGLSQLPSAHPWVQAKQGTARRLDAMGMGTAEGLRQTGSLSVLGIQTASVPIEGLMGGVKGSHDEPPTDHTERSGFLYSPSARASLYPMSALGDLGQGFPGLLCPTIPFS